MQASRLVGHPGSIVVEWKQKLRSFPLFKEFLSFVVKVADTAYDPITSLQAVRGNRSDKHAKLGQRKEVNA